MKKKEKRTKRQNNKNSKQETDKMKYEIANEFGVNLRNESSSNTNCRDPKGCNKKGMNKSNRSNNKLCD